MKTLSLLQPWASLVVIGAKQIETRSWSTKYRGELLIHASLSKKAAFLAREKPFSRHISDFSALPFGAIIGKVRLIEVIRIGPGGFTKKDIGHVSPDEKAFDDFTEGRYAWMLEGPQAFPVPIPVKGSLGLWEFDLDRYRHGQ